MFVMKCDSIGTAKTNADVQSSWSRLASPLGFSLPACSAGCRLSVLQRPLIPSYPECFCGVWFAEVVFSFGATIRSIPEFCFCLIVLAFNVYLEDLRSEKLQQGNVDVDCHISVMRAAPIRDADEDISSMWIHCSLKLHNVP